MASKWWNRCGKVSLIRGHHIYMYECIWTWIIKEKLILETDKTARNKHDDHAVQGWTWYQARSLFYFQALRHLEVPCHCQCTIVCLCWVDPPETCITHTLHCTCMYATNTKLAKSTVVNNPAIVSEARNCKPSVTKLASTLHTLLWLLQLCMTPRVKSISLIAKFWRPSWCLYKSLTGIAITFGWYGKLLIFV